MASLYCNATFKTIKKTKLMPYHNIKLSLSLYERIDISVAYFKVHMCSTVSQTQRWHWLCLTQMCLQDTHTYTHTQTANKNSKQGVSSRVCVLIAWFCWQFCHYITQSFDSIVFDHTCDRTPPRQPAATHAHAHVHTNAPAHTHTHMRRTQIKRRRRQSAGVVCLPLMQ